MAARKRRTARTSRRFVVSFVVTADHADSHGVTEAEVRDYIKEALYRWGGGGDPRDGLFDGLKTWKLYVYAIPMGKKGGRS